MSLDQNTATLLPLGTRVSIETLDGALREAIRVPAPYAHMSPAFQWISAPAGEHPLAWFDIAGRVHMPAAVAEA